MGGEENERGQGSRGCGFLQSCGRASMSGSCAEWENVSSFVFFRRRGTKIAFLFSPGGYFFSLSDASPPHPCLLSCQIEILKET